MTKTEIVTVTPEMAALWLEGNNNNRAIRQSAVDQYAADMAKGEWKLNGSSVVFSKDGRLLDGQHRLFGCLMAGTAFQTVVVHGLEEEVFTTIDQGRFRNPGDHLKIAGHDVGGNQNRYSAALGAVQRYDNDSTLSNSRVPPGNLIAAAAANPGFEAWFSFVHGKLGRGLRGFSTQIAAVTYIARRSRMYLSQTESFVDRLHTGAGLEAGSPILSLRNRMINDPPSEKSVRFYIVVTAWNHYAKGKNLFKIAPTRDGHMPRIVGDNRTANEQKSAG